MSRKSPIYYGWFVLLGCAGIQFFFSATFMNGFTVYFNPLVDEFGWSYAIVSLATTFRGFEIGVFSPVVGFFVDKFGPRKLLLTSSILGVLGFLLFSQIQSLWTYFTAFVILGISISLSSSVVIMPPIIKWFKKRPALAMGIVLSGSAISGLLVPGIVWLVDTSGWRNTLFYFAIVAAVLCIPLSLLVKDPPVTDNKQINNTVTAKPLSTRETAKNVIKKRNFWLLSLAIAFSGFAPAAISAHQIPYLVSVGMSREVAGWMVVVFSLSGMVGRLSFGWLGDIIDKRLCFVISVLLQTIGLVVYAYSGSVATVFPSLVAFGAGVGGNVTLRNALQLEFFGISGFAVIQGLLLVFVTIGLMAAPPLAGWIYDSVHAYRSAWIIFAVLSLIALPLIVSAAKPKVQTNQAPEK